MPNIKSAKKRESVNNQRAARNKAVKSELKTVLKKADAAIAGGDANKDALVKVAVKKIDQAAAKGVIHKNNAARKKAQLACKVAKA